MKIEVLPIGQVDTYVVGRIRENLGMVFPQATICIAEEKMQIPREAFSEQRQQHCSKMILNNIEVYVQRNKNLDKALGVVDTDIYAPKLNFVFGEALFPGKAALISLCRLKEEFYKRKPNFEQLIERATKEAVHELGHNLGLSHCSDPFCVMYFSNSIFETDRKRNLFCNRCQSKIRVDSTLPEGQH